MFNKSFATIAPSLCTLRLNPQKNFPILNPCYQRVKKSIKKKTKKEAKSLVGTKKISTFAPALEQKFTHKLED